MKETRSLPAELFAGRTLIFQLAKNDFKKKYAGSYLGIVWAFVQPVVTVMVYWFVFGMIRSSSPRPVPFVADRRTDSLVLFSGRTDQRNECTAGIQLSGQKGGISD